MFRYPQSTSEPCYNSMRDWVTYLHKCAVQFCMHTYIFIASDRYDGYCEAHTIRTDIYLLQNTKIWYEEHKEF